MDVNKVEVEVEVELSISQYDNLRHKHPELFHSLCPMPQLYEELSKNFLLYLCTVVRWYEYISVINSILHSNVFADVPSCIICMILYATFKSLIHNKQQKWDGNYILVQNWSKKEPHNWDVPYVWSFHCYSLIRYLLDMVLHILQPVGQSICNILNLLHLRT
jgi:hypothetical protein